MKTIFAKPSVVVCLVLTIISHATSPSALAQTLYVSDMGLNAGTGGKVLQFTTGGTGSLFAAGPYGLSGIAFDSAGHLYLGGYTNNGIERFAPDASHSTLVGPGSPGAPSDFSNFQPYGIKFDATGNLFVTGSNSLWKVTSTGTVSLFTTLETNSRDVAFDAAGNIYVSLGTSKIVRFSPAGDSLGTFVSLLPGTFATGLAFDDTGNLYYAWGGSIRKHSSAGAFLAEFASPVALYGNGFHGLAIDPTYDVLYAATGPDGLILSYGLDGTYLGVFADGSDGLSRPTFLAFSSAVIPEPSTYGLMLGLVILPMAILSRRMSGRFKSS